MSTTYSAIKTYAGIPMRFHGAKCPDGSDPVWDEGLQQNTCLIKPRTYSADDAKPPTGFDKAGEELDRLAREHMASTPGTTYHAAFKQVLAANPALKAVYGGTK